MNTMTKLKLNLAHGAGEILTREELKKVLGGTGSGSGSGGWDGDYTSIRDANGNKVTKNYVRGVNREIVVNTIDITHLDSLYIGMVYVRTQVGHIVSFATLDDYIVFYIPLNTS